MKLWYAAASPFVRKVLVLAHETEIVDQLEIVDQQFQFHTWTDCMTERR